VGKSPTMCQTCVRRAQDGGRTAPGTRRRSPDRDRGVQRSRAGWVAGERQNSPANSASVSNGG
jgi:hypothetical protein